MNAISCDTGKPELRLVFRNSESLEAGPWVQPSEPLSAEPEVVGAHQVADDTDSVFLLWHVHVIDDEHDDEKVIGIYRTREDAQAAIVRMSKVTGFRDAPEGFEISEYLLNKDNWTEGFVTIVRPHPKS